MYNHKFLITQECMSLISMLFKLDTTVIDMENKRYVGPREHYSTVGKRINLTCYSMESK